MSWEIRSAVIASFGFLAACGGGKTEQPPNVSKAEFDALRDRLQTAETNLSRLQTTVVLNSLSGPREQALFDPQESKGYTAIYGPAGPVLVVLERLDPYLDGFTVTLRLGNPTGAIYAGLKAKVRWGRLYDATKDAQYNRLREKEVELRDVLLSGTWTNVKFNIAPATPEEVRRIVIEPTFSEVRLRTVSTAPQ